MRALLVTTHQRGNANRTHQRPHFLLKTLVRSNQIKSRSRVIIHGCNQVLRDIWMW